MINKVIEHFTRMLGKPANWSEEDHGKCGALAIRDIGLDYGGNGVMINTMISAWEPEPHELKALNSGATVYLRLLGTSHPPVALWVGEPHQMPADPRTGRAIGDHGTANQAIEYAVHHADEPDAFLRGWQQGDLDEWPEYYAWLTQNPG